jgi:hypothetical protein
MVFVPCDIIYSSCVPGVFGKRLDYLCTFRNDPPTNGSISRRAKNFTSVEGIPTKTIPKLLEAGKMLSYPSCE